MTELIPGRFYRATVRGVPDATILVGRDYAVTSEVTDGHYLHNLSAITDARPLIVLDPGRAQVRDFLRVYGEDRSSSYIPSRLARMIEAQTEPPRIPEPGQWGVVEASCEHSDERGAWVHDPLGWARVGHEQIKTYNHDAWDSLIDPTHIRDGIEAS